MRTFSLAQKRGSRNMIQHAEFRYSPSGAVVSLTSYDGDHPAFRTGIHQNSKEMCRYSENHEQAEYTATNQGRNFNDTALQLAARASLHPIGWRRVPGQQNRAAHIRKIKECTVRMRFSARKTAVQGIKISVPQAMKSRLPDVVIHYQEPDVAARTSNRGTHRHIRATCRNPKNRKTLYEVKKSQGSGV